MPDPDNPTDVRHLTEALSTVPEWALRAPSIYPRNLAQKVLEFLRRITFVPIPPPPPSFISRGGRGASSSSSRYSSSSKNSGAAKKQHRTLPVIERDENDPRSLAAPLNRTAQQIERAYASHNDNPVVCDILQADSEVLLRTDLGKQIVFKLPVCSTETQRKFLPLRLL